MKTQTAKLRDGTELSIGDLVETDWTPKCEGVIFEIFEIAEHDTCESGFMLQVHVQGQPDRIFKSKNGKGFDTNTFKKIKIES